MYGLSLLVAQRGLSPTEDMVASSPTMAVPKHGKVGVKEGDMQRHTENEMERKREGGGGRERVMTARGAVSHFSVLPPKP